MNHKIYIKLLWALISNKDFDNFNHKTLIRLINKNYIEGSVLRQGFLVSNSLINHEFSNQGYKYHCFEDTLVNFNKTGTVTNSNGETVYFYSCRAFDYPYSFESITNDMIKKKFLRRLNNRKSIVDFKYSKVPVTTADVEYFRIPTNRYLLVRDHGFGIQSPLVSDTDIRRHLRSSPYFHRFSYSGPNGTQEIISYERNSIGMINWRELNPYIIKYIFDSFNAAQNDPILSSLGISENDNQKEFLIMDNDFSLTTNSAISHSLLVASNCDLGPSIVRNFPFGSKVIDYSKEYLISLIYEKMKND